VRRAAPLAIVAGAVALLGGAGWLGYRFLTTSPRFAIASIEVRGTANLSPDQVRAALPFGRGHNIFTIDTGAAEAALRRQPWIATAHVERRLPRTVVVDVHERRAAAVVVAGASYLVDRDGRPFKRAVIERGEAEGLPVVTGVSRDLFGQVPDQAAARVRRGLAVLAAWTDPAEPERPAAGEVRVEERDTTLYTWDDAVAVRVGAATGDDLRGRLARFDAAWAALSPDERRRARTVHVDDDTRPDLVTVSFATN